MAKSSYGWSPHCQLHQKIGKKKKNTRWLVIHLFLVRLIFFIRWKFPFPIWKFPIGKFHTKSINEPNAYFAKFHQNTKSKSKKQIFCFNIFFFWKKFGQIFEKKIWNIFMDLSAIEQHHKIEKIKNKKWFRVLDSDFNLVAF